MNHEDLDDESTASVSSNHFDFNALNTNTVGISYDAKFGTDIVELFNHSEEKSSIQNRRKKFFWLIPRSCEHKVKFPLSLKIVTWT